MYMLHRHAYTELHKSYLIKFWHTWHTGVHLQETGNKTISKNPHGLYSWKGGLSANTLFTITTVDSIVSIP